jgi:hypothetical protein
MTLTVSGRERPPANFLSLLSLSIKPTWRQMKWITVPLTYIHAYWIWHVSNAYQLGITCVRHAYHCMWILSILLMKGFHSKRWSFLLFLRYFPLPFFCTNVSAAPTPSPNVGSSSKTFVSFD